jgi:hypothetical protein
VSLCGELAVLANDGACKVGYPKQPLHPVSMTTFVLLIDVWVGLSRQDPFTFPKCHAGKRLSESGDMEQNE